MFAACLLVPLLILCCSYLYSAQACLVIHSTAAMLIFNLEHPRPLYALPKRLILYTFCLDICSYLYERTRKVPGVQVYGPSPAAAGHRGRASLCTFNVDGLHATDLSTLLDASGVAVRSGHHCTQPIHR